MINTKNYEFWFVTGSQHLYGSETLKQVDNHSKEIADFLSKNTGMVYKIVFKPVLTTPDAISKLCIEANSNEFCAGLITWMHTFSPAKMWIAGLSVLNKPILHLHTQFNRDIPWDTIDMDFMNLNQSAHGDREYGFIGARMNIRRKVVAGYWKDAEVLSRINSWMNTAVSFQESKILKIARFGDNMREVAVTEGDKVEAQIKFGWSTNGYGIGDLVKRINEIPENLVDRLIEEYGELYEISSETRKAQNFNDAVKEQARIELGMKSFLEEGNFGAFTTTFEDLYGLKQLPGLAVQRLMSAGYGFGAEGDWKTSAVVRIMKIMSGGKRTSFMEDYTYHLEPGKEMILGAHMLEVCPTISSSKAKLEVHPLGIGGKSDPARLVFDGDPGSAICVSLIDLGSRFRMIINEVESVKIEKKMPKLPVARVLWKPFPSLRDSTESWIIAGGAHHTSFSLNIKSESMIDWADMMGIECILIDKKSTASSIKRDIQINNIIWK
jgi:L-arabinose isomerase